VVLQVRFLAETQAQRQFRQPVQGRHMRRHSVLTDPQHPQLLQRRQRWRQRIFERVKWSLHRPLSSVSAVRLLRARMSCCEVQLTMLRWRRLPKAEMPAGRPLKSSSVCELRASRRRADSRVHRSSSMGKPSGATTGPLKPSVQLASDGRPLKAAKNSPRLTGGRTSVNSSEMRP